MLWDRRNDWEEESKWRFSGYFQSRQWSKVLMCHIRQMVRQNVRAEKNWNANKNELFSARPALRKKNANRTFAPLSLMFDARVQTVWLDHREVEWSQFRVFLYGRCAYNMCIDKKAEDVCGAGNFLDFRLSQPWYNFTSCRMKRLRLNERYLFHVTLIMAIFALPNTRYIISHLLCYAVCLNLTVLHSLGQGSELL